MLWIWSGFIAFVLVLLALDLGVFHRKAHVVSVREALEQKKWKQAEEAAARVASVLEAEAGLISEAAKKLRVVGRAGVGVDNVVRVGGSIVALPLVGGSSWPASAAMAIEAAAGATGSASEPPP